MSHPKFFFGKMPKIFFLEKCKKKFFSKIFFQKIDDDVIWSIMSHHVFQKHSLMGETDSL